MFLEIEKNLGLRTLNGYETNDWRSLLGRPFSDCLSVLLNRWSFELRHFCRLRLPPLKQMRNRPCQRNIVAAAIFKFVSRL